MATVIREVSEGSHDVAMGDTVSSDAMQTRPLLRVMPKTQQRLLMSQVQLSSQVHHRRQLVYLAHPRQRQGQLLERRHHQASFSLLKTSSRMSTTRHRAKSGLLSRTSLSKFSSKRRHSLQPGSTQQMAIAVKTCGLTMSMPGRRVTAQVRGFISRSTRCSSVRTIHT